MTKTQENLSSFKVGLREGIPIGLGYLSVSFSFGVMAVTKGLSILNAVLISATNLTSAGQFAGLSVIVESSGFLTIALTQLVINIRYSLMSLSLSQKLNGSVTSLQRCIMAFGITDETFAIASSKKGELSAFYMFGLISFPIFGWSLGTFLGAAASSLMPAFLQSALGIAIYGMFIAIIIPPSKKSKSVAFVVLIAVILSCIIYFAPVFSKISDGFSIIICTVIASIAAAILFPVKEVAKND